MTNNQIFENLHKICEKDCWYKVKRNPSSKGYIAYTWKCLWWSKMGWIEPNCDLDYVMSKN